MPPVTPGWQRSAQTPLAREVLRAERKALQNSNVASTTERLRQQQEEANIRRNATKRLRCGEEREHEVCCA